MFDVLTMHYFVNKEKSVRPACSSEPSSALLSDVGPQENNDALPTLTRPLFLRTYRSSSLRRVAEAGSRLVYEFINHKPAPS